MQVAANGITLEVDVHGPADGEPLLLVMGLGMQLLAWDDGFVARLVDRGFRVIRYDNRDIGLSENFDHLGTPNVVVDAIRLGLGMKIRSPYSLADMADDAAGLLDALGIESAHVCGASMGGMIGQRLAAKYPGRVRSLVLMMTTSGARRLPGPGWRVRMAMLARPRDPDDIDSVVAHYMRLYRVIGSPGFPEPERTLRARIERVVRRSYRPRGSLRQLVAIVADADRSPLLRTIRAPTLVIHGRSDPLLPVASAHDLAAKIAGARLDLVDGMGHDLPEALWPRFVADIEAIASSVRAR